MTLEKENYLSYLILRRKDLVNQRDEEKDFEESQRLNNEVYKLNDLIAEERIKILKEKNHETMA